jgi:uncharacterized protein with GYD domain
LKTTITKFNPEKLPTDAHRFMLICGARTNLSSRSHAIENRNPLRRTAMAKYLLEVSYLPDGVKGILKEGGSRRREVVGAAIKEHGGKLEAFYFAFGKYDAYLIVDVPDPVRATSNSPSRMRPRISIRWRHPPSRP